MDLLEKSISIVGRLSDAYARQRAQSGLLKQHCEELLATRSVIIVVRHEKFLQTASIISQLARLKDLSRELLTLLNRLAPSESAIPRFVHQLTSGAKDENDLDSIIKKLNNAKTNLLIHIQVAGVGLTRDNQNHLIANAAIIDRVDRFIRDQLGDNWTLKIASLVRNQQTQGMYSADPDQIIGGVCEY